MKFLFITALLFSSQSFAQVSDYEVTTCEKLSAQAEVTCHEVLWQQCKDDGFTDQECEDGQDGDYAVAHQECSWGELHEVLVPAHNTAKPKQKINCED